MVITIDGPAGAGKSTVAKELAKRLQFTYLDTGAMYRALTLKALREKEELIQEERLVKLAQRTVIDFKMDPKGALRVYLDGQDVSEDIRSLEVTNNTFYIARAAGVRAIMVDWQRRIGKKNNVVVEGRDAGTVIFPEAPTKFYLDADFEVRSQRRIKELQAAGKTVDENTLKSELKERDHKDMSRAVGPLKKAEGAIVIDSTDSSVQDVVEKILGILKDNGYLK